jgi:AcrR family transcriptional regulator
MTKPLRADAQRNRARILDVAEKIFATKGTAAPTEEVARAAGVGIGTVFRHFPTKEELLEAVYVARLERLAAEAQRLTTQGDPATALATFFTSSVTAASTKNALAEALAEAGVSIERAHAEAGKGLRSAIAVLLVRAQRAGGVRTDIDVADLLNLMIGASRAVAGLDDAARDRVLAVFLDGLRPPATTRS